MGSGRIKLHQRLLELIIRSRYGALFTENENTLRASGIISVTFVHCAPDHASSGHVQCARLRREHLGDHGTCILLSW